MGLLDGKVAIVTGAGGGLGREHALLLASEGAAVIVNDLGGDRSGQGGGSSMADAVVDEIKSKGGEAVASYASVSTVEGGESVVKTAVDAFGHADILVNNAGILRDKSFSNMEEADWDAVITVHLKGTYCCTKPMFAHLKERAKGGVIINTSSTSGLNGNFGQTNYGAAKAGIAGFTRCLAIEGKKYGIRVWGLVPVAMTRMTEDLQGMAAMKDRLPPNLVSHAILYMASSLSGERTGHFLFSGGGTVREMKVVSAKGISLGAKLNAEAIQAHENDVFLPESSR
jgi:NAD(P)-dependent dehydrogenase (short-subunit alcohol dehydrogenase family)